MGLVIDNRATTPGPGVHALIVGVSDYVNLPDRDDPSSDAKWFLNKLTGAALSAFRMHEFIMNSTLRLPLKTVRLLLSPSPTELAAEPALGQVQSSRADRKTFDAQALDWQNDAKDNPKDMTIFFFSGHGLQRTSDEGVLLLEDFLAAGPQLARCIEIGSVFKGMQPTGTYPNMALTQFYFIDACLTRPETQKKFVNPQVPDVFDQELNAVDRREAPIVFSTVDGAIALGREGMPSHFTEALTLALQRGAEDPTEVDGKPVWPVTSLTLKTAFDGYYSKNKLGTKVKMGGVVGTPVIRYLDGPPDVDISIQVQPGDIGNPCKVWLFDENDAAMPSCNPAEKTQIETTVKAGLYRVQIDSTRLQANPYRSARKFITQRGPWPWSHNLAALLKPQ